MIAGKFAVGGRVICIRGDGTAEVGMEGTVVGVPAQVGNPSIVLVGVFWDDFVKNMHDFGGFLGPAPPLSHPVPGGHGWYVFPDQLEPCSDMDKEKEEFGVIGVHGNKEV